MAVRGQDIASVIKRQIEEFGGSVGMVEMALERLEKEGMISLDEERKANMVSNLMSVLCSENPIRPIINTGSLY